MAWGVIALLLGASRGLIPLFVGALLFCTSVIRASIEKSRS